MVRALCCRSLFIVTALAAVCGPQQLLAQGESTAPPRDVEAALDAPLSSPIRAHSFAELATALAESQNINVVLDEQGLKDAGISPSRYVTFEAQDMTLRSAVAAMLRPYDLCGVVDNGVLRITTIDDRDNQTICRVHPVAGLLAEPDASPDYDSLCVLIETAVAPSTWPEGTGPGPIVGGWGCLVFNQTAEVHDTTARLLSALLALKTKDPANVAPIPIVRPAELAFEARLNERLDAHIDLTLDAVTLDEFVALLREQYKLPVRLDTRALENARVNPLDAKISLSVRGIPLRSASALALESLDLATFCRDEQLWISSADAAQYELRLAIYPVGDLAADEDALEVLSRAIQLGILPDTWNGGPASVQSFAPLKCLVISQTDRGHACLVEFLRDLRASAWRTCRPARLLRCRRSRTFTWSMARRPTNSSRRYPT